MVYVTQPVTAITEIPAAVSAIAALQGWTVDNTVPAAPIFTLPTTDPSIDWKLSATIASYDQTLTWTASGSAVPTSTASIRSPKLAPPSGTNPVVPLPQNIHVFISPAPSDTPYLAIVVEYEANLFRHLYLGVMEKLGDYGGGEVISGASAYLATHGSNLEYTYNNFLFESFNTNWAANACGGVHIDHASNPTYPWRIFRGNGGALTSMPANTVLGGYFDSINDGYVARGSSPFAGVNVLSPINLYASRPISGGMDFVPIGRPPGVRHVHMEALDPGASFNIGGTVWRVFPAMAKNSDPVQPKGNGNWRVYESSWWLGYAYPES